MALIYDKYSKTKLDIMHQRLCHLSQEGGAVSFDDLIDVVEAILIDREDSIGMDILDKKEKKY